MGKNKRVPAERAILRRRTWTEEKGIGGEND